MTTEPRIIIVRESHLPALLVGMMAGAAGLAFWQWVVGIFVQWVQMILGRI